MTAHQPRRVTESGPVHDHREIEAVVEVLQDGTLDLGPGVSDNFERLGADLLAKRHGVMVNSVRRPSGWPWISWNASVATRSSPRR